MKYDMHCHTKEGSIDAKVDILTYASRLKEKGFTGMLITDHNSYKGYETWLKAEKPGELKDFYALKGIEYDTSDGGHVLVVLPDGVHCPLLEIRGMSIYKLERIVHKLGGIIGPAHPYGTGFFAIKKRLATRKNTKLFEKFDFIEGFNACIHPRSNEKAKALAKDFKKPQFGGSDAHHKHVVGSAYTRFNKKIKSNNDLIRYIKTQQKTYLGGNKNKSMGADHGKIVTLLGVIGYYVYNFELAMFYLIPRIFEHRKYIHADRPKA